MKDDSSIWYGLALGGVIGGDNSDSKGGAKNLGSDSDGGHGLFSLFGHEVWVYIGGILGFGKTAGIYLTTGPMIGSDPDWAIGGGVHIAKSIGVGVVVPIRKTMQYYNDHQDKITTLLNVAHDYYTSLQHHIVDNAPTAIAGLEHIIRRVC